MKFHQAYRRFVKLSTIYFTATHRLTLRQRSEKLKIELFLRYVILVFLIILTVLYIALYYRVTKVIHFENIPYARTGTTSVTCINGDTNSIICCADRPYLLDSHIINTSTSFDIYECYMMRVSIS